MRTPAKSAKYTALHVDIAQHLDISQSVTLGSAPRHERRVDCAPYIAHQRTKEVNIKCRYCTALDISQSVTLAQVGKTTKRQKCT